MMPACRWFGLPSSFLLLSDSTCRDCDWLDNSNRAFSCCHCFASFRVTSLSVCLFLRLFLASFIHSSLAFDLYFDFIVNWWYLPFRGFLAVGSFDSNHCSKQGLLSFLFFRWRMDLFLFTDPQLKENRLIIMWGAQKSKGKSHSWREWEVFWGGSRRRRDCTGKSRDGSFPSTTADAHKKKAKTNIQPQTGTRYLKLQMKLLQTYSHPRFTQCGWRKFWFGMNS